MAHCRRNDTLSSELIFISLVLTFAYCYLSVNIKQHFARELKDEGNRIEAIFVFFSLSYISRAVVYLLQRFMVIKHVAVVYHIMYFFWDVPPLSLIMRFHYQCFKAQEAYDNRQAQSDAVLATQADSSDTSSSSSSSARSSDLTSSLRDSTCESTDAI